MLRLLLPLFFTLLCTSGRAQSGVKISSVTHLERTHFQVKTTSATYLYDPVAGGFSSIIDPSGKDWVQYRDTPWGEYPASAASSFRGLPNLVYGGDDDGAGHPGHKKCESKVVGKNRIQTVSLSGDWTWTWTFYKDCARLDVEKAPTDRNYWFLYEGPAGGVYRPQSTFWATDQSHPSYDLYDHYQGKIHRGQYRYMYFGEDSSPRVFFMLQATSGQESDHISYLGNDKQGALASKDGMVVAGFGRTGGATPLLTGQHTFLIGFRNFIGAEERLDNRLRTGIERLARRRGKERVVGN